MVVLALISILAMLAASNLSSLMGRYRMNGAAREFAEEVEACRVRAISENREYIVRLTGSDPTPLDGEFRRNVGSYEIARGEHHHGSTEWDIVENGARDLGAGPGQWKGVSIEPWTPISGPPSYNLTDALVFSPRGHLLNDPSDFTGGVLRVVFRNKATTSPEARVVRVSRGGGTQIAASN